MKRLTTVGLLMLSLTCTSKPFNYASNLGIAVETYGHMCLSIPNSSLVPGQRVQFVSATTPPVVGEAEITGKADEACAAADQNRLGMTRYSFNVVQGTLGKGAAAFVVANFGKPLNSSGEGISADLEQDGKPEVFRFCTSAEGLHLTVWKGSPLTGQRKWHDYYYLGFDVTPNCTESETKPDAAR